MDDFMPQLGSTKDQVDENYLHYNEPDLPLSALKSLQDYDDKIAMLHRAYLKKVYRLKR